MRTLARTSDQVAIRGRLATLSPGDQARWGLMSAEQAVCHMTDAFFGAIGRIAVAPVKSQLPPALFKLLALRFPRKWPPGVPTVPEMKQGLGGTPPAHFAADMAALHQAFDDFLAFAGPWPRHPIFGAMTAADWMRWGFLHTDHHLRQFGR